MSQNGSTAARGGVLLLLVLAVAIVPALAADTWPNCAFKCTAGDVTLVSIYAVVAGGACESGGTTMAQIYGRFTASAQRYAVILIGDLHVEGGTTQRLEQCAGDLPAGTTDVLLTTVAWPCGRAITLGNINVSWSTNRETCADATCASRAAQCSKAEDLAVTTPLVVDFTSNAPRCLGTAMAFTSQTVGGASPFTYQWSFGDGGTSSQANPSTTYTAAGTYTVTLTVRDRAGATGSRSRAVTVSARPTAAASNGGPYCPGQAIFLSANGGATYAWTGPGGFTSSAQNPTIPSASEVKAGTYTVTVTNAGGCSASATTAVVVDSTPPVLTLPPNAAVSCGGSTSPAATGQATATDNSGMSPTLTTSDAGTLTGCSGTGIISRTWTATDACGNTSMGFQSIVVADTTPPSLTLPANVVVECGHSTLPAATGHATAIDACSTPTVTHTDTANLSGCSGSGTITRTWTAADACGNVSSGTQTITVVDATAPTLTVPRDVTIGCHDSTSPAATGQATAADACSTPTVTYADRASLNGCSGSGTLVRTWTAADACGNAASGTQTITVVDASAPSLTVPADVVIECGHSTLPAATGQATATDTCSTPAVTYTDTADLSGCSGSGTLVRTWRATDACGNVASGIQTITVVDATAPTLTVPGDVTVGCHDATSPEAAGRATAIDNCSAPTVSFTDVVHLTGCSGSGAILRTWRATDACNNVATAVQTITVADDDPPTLTVPGDVEVQAGQSTLPAATGQATATDECSTAAVSYADASLLGADGTGTITRTWTATDACGHATSGTQIITVKSAPPPPLLTLTVPANVTVEAGGPTDPTSTGQPTASDTCPTTPTVTYADVATLTGCDGTGTLLRTWTASDACGSSASAVQTITVVDTGHMILTVPANITIEAGEPTDPTATGRASASDPDAVDEPPAVIYTDATDLTGCDGTGTILRTWIATDGCGNATSAVQTITVVDTGHMILTVPADITMESGESTDPTATGRASASDPDAVDEPPAVTYTDVADLTGCDGTGTILRTWTATDECGNAASAVQTITVVDSGHMILTVPADITIESGEPTGPAATGWASASDPDAVDEPPVVIYTDAADLTGCDGTGTILRTWTATDECGNATSAVQTITVVDTGHMILTVPANITMEAEESTDPSTTGWASASDPDAVDEPPAVTYTDAADLTGCDGTGTILRTWMATDECGNATSGVQTITVVDTGHSTLLLPPDVTLACGQATDPAATGWASASDADAVDEPPAVTYVDEADLSGCGGTGTVLRTWTATDECNNAVSGTQTLYVVDATPPTLVVPRDVAAECGGSTLPTMTGLAMASDACSTVSVTHEDQWVPGGCGDTGTILRTWTASDACGNFSTGVQTIVLVDTTAPALVVPPAILVECGHSTSTAATGQATASDNGSTPVVGYIDRTSAGTCGGGTVVERTWTAVDACGNVATGVQTISLVDSTAPGLTIPADAVVQVGASILPTFTGLAAGTDECSAVTVTYADESHLALDGAGTISRTWTATDACGNAASAIQIITLSAVPPTPYLTLTMPTDRTVDAGRPTDPSATGTALATGSCSTPPTVTYTDQTRLGGCDGTGTILRTWKASDACGGIATGVQTITVVDVGQIVLLVPADLTVSCGDSTDPASTGWASANDPDATDEPPTVVFTDQAALDPCSGAGTLLRTWTATDACGNAVSAVQAVTIAGSCAPRVVISEIAWAGTATDPANEWIELRNLGDHETNLEGWTLRWRSAKPETPQDRVWKTVTLHGVLAPSFLHEGPQPRATAGNPATWWLDLLGLRPTPDYLLVERISDATVANVSAGVVYDAVPEGQRSLELSDGGEIVELVAPGGCVVDTANAERRGLGGWAAGDVATRGTMERTDSRQGDVETNWHTNLGLITYGVDTAGGSLVATAGTDNQPFLGEFIASEILAFVPIGGGGSVEVPLPTGAPQGDGTATRAIAFAQGSGTSSSFSVRVSSTGTSIVVTPSGAVPPGAYNVWIRIGNMLVLVPLRAT
jgi:hypothetical protein